MTRLREMDKRDGVLRRNLADPATMQDEDGRVYLPDGCSAGQPLRVTELDSKTFKLKSDPVETVHADVAHRGWEIPGDNNLREDARPWIEGPWVNKINGHYYLQYAAPGTQFKTCADGVYVSDKPIGPFVYQPYWPFSFSRPVSLRAPGIRARLPMRAASLWHVATMTISSATCSSGWRSGFRRACWPTVNW